MHGYPIKLWFLQKQKHFLPLDQNKVNGGLSIAKVSNDQQDLTNLSLFKIIIELNYTYNISHKFILLTVYSQTNINKQLV